MKKCFVIIVLTCITTIMFGQNNPRPSKSRFWLNKHATFQIKPGDVLVYDVKNGADKSELLITIKDVTDGITFDYNNNSNKGTIHLSKTSITSGVTYQTMFPNINLQSSTGNKGMLWLSQNNYRQLAANTSKQTKMDMGNGLESFVRKSGSVQKIIYKGQEKIMTVYKIASVDAASKKEFSVLTDLTNPLIVAWSGEGVITLKEVR